MPHKLKYDWPWQLQETDDWITAMGIYSARDRGESPVLDDKEQAALERYEHRQRLKKGRDRKYRAKKKTNC